jgi:aminotransferase
MEFFKEGLNLYEIKNKDSVFSNNVTNIEISGIRKFYNKIIEVPEAISLTLGQPDFNVPENIKNAMIRAIVENKTTYTSNAGIIELREKISQFLNDYGISFEADEICLTIGGSEGLLSVFTTFINKGDKVMIPTPAYPAYESCIKLLGGQVVEYNLNDDFSINFQELEEKLDLVEPKLIIVSYPSNPTGAVLTKEDRDKLYELLISRETIIITDEIYSSLCFDENYYSISQFPSLKSKTILVSGFSKMFSMTGLRLGYVCANKVFMDQIMKVHQYNVSCAPSIVQWGAYEGLKTCLEDVEHMKNEFNRRKKYVYDRLVAMGMDTANPKGAFYIFPSISKYKISSDEFCERLLKEGKLAVVPGSAFGTGGEGYIRISYSYSMEVLEEALNRLEKFIKGAFY